MSIEIKITDPAPDLLEGLLVLLKGGKAPAITTGGSKAATSKTEKKEDPKEDAKDVAPTFERLKELVVEKTQAGKGAKVKELYAKYKTEKLTTMLEEDYAAFFEDIKKL